MKAAVLGSPVRHSLSPVLHGAAYAALGLHDWDYDLVECDEAGLAGFVAGLGPEWAGLSLTMPLKRAALDVADAVSPVAAAVAAANTLVLRDGRRYAENTDVAGIVTTLRRAGVALYSAPLCMPAATPVTATAAAGNAGSSWRSF